MMRLYVAQRGGLVKIGISAAPEKRRVALGARLVWQSDPHISAAGVEAAALRVLRRVRVPGKREWFAASPALARRVVQRAIRRSFYERIAGEWAPRLAKEATGK